MTAITRCQGCGAELRNGHGHHDTRCQFFTLPTTHVADNPIKLSVGHVSAPVSKWNYDMASCPVGVKCLLLNTAGVAVFGPLVSATRMYFRAWSPLPQRDKELENALGILQHP